MKIIIKQDFNIIIWKLIFFGNSRIPADLEPLIWGIAPYQYLVSCHSSHSTDFFGDQHTWRVVVLLNRAILAVKDDN